MRGRSGCKRCGTNIKVVRVDEPQGCALRQYKTGPCSFLPLEYCPANLHGLVPCNTTNCYSSSLLNFRSGRQDLRKTIPALHYTNFINMEPFNRVFKYKYCTIIGKNFKQLIGFFGF